ncbi:MAG: GNAT family N-acetyltransferase [Candidatus Amulumruptor caecigallinarius]|nr:GNAT family N-acetyltransferase [Candidatus Amulumruptor caecigallinarius]
MVGTGEISAAAHHDFVEGLRTRRDKQYYALYMPDGVLAGSVTLSHREPQELERGIWLFAGARGKGVATAALKALYDFLRRERGVERIFTRVRLENRSSLALEHALGALETDADNEYAYFTTLL